MGFHQTGISGNPDENIGELADLGQSHAYQYRGPERITKQFHNRTPDYKLADYDDCNDGPEESRIRDESFGIYESADRNKEESDERIPQRKQLRQYFMPGLRFTDDHSGQKGA